MSFGIPPNTISCYYILTRADTFRNVGNAGFNIRQVTPTVGGDLSGSFSISEINIRFPDFVQSPTTIIQNAPDVTSNNTFIVGIPERNGNNISRNQIIHHMKNFNINTLRNIVPYVKQMGNEVTIPNIPDDCIDPIIRHRQVLAFKSRRLNRQDLISFLSIIRLQQRRLCLRNLDLNTII